MFTLNHPAFYDRVKLLFTEALKYNGQWTNCNFHVFIVVAEKKKAKSASQKPKTIGKTSATLKLFLSNV